MTSIGILWKFCPRATRPPRQGARGVALPPLRTAATAGQAKETRMSRHESRQDAEYMHVHADTHDTQPLPHPQHTNTLTPTIHTTALTPTTQIHATRLADAQLNKNTLSPSGGRVGPPGRARTANPSFEQHPSGPREE